MFIDFLLEIITAASVSAALTGLLLWLIKSWISQRLKHAIKNEYDEKMTTHKVELKAQSDVEIENLKSRLSIVATEHQVRFSKLHQERADVIAETYSLLKELYFRLGDYVKIFELAGDAPKEKRCDDAAEAHKQFHGYYPKKLIFLPKKTAKKVQDIARGRSCRTCFADAIFARTSPNTIK